jgi:hypothetical protein
VQQKVAAERLNSASRGHRSRAESGRGYTRANQGLANRFPSAYSESLEAGIKFAWEQVRIADASLHGLTVRGVHPDYNPVDSTRVCMAYAAAGALLRAMGKDGLLPPFRPDNSWNQLINKSANTE